MYVLPQVLVFQEATIAPTANNNPLRAHVAGPHAYLLRYGEADEKELGRLGVYDRLLDAVYPWPHRPAGALVDQAYTKVYLKDALLKYFEDNIGSGSTITKTAGYNNRVRSATVNFAANGTTYPRNAALLDRDVQVGDVVKVRGLNGDSDSVTLWTYVQSIVGDQVDAIIAAAETDTANPATQSASSSVVRLTGPVNCVTLTPDHSAYDGLASGRINETYDILVTESSVNGDFTTAKIRIISGSGTDDVLDVTPAAAGDPTDIGTRGLTVAFDKDAGPDCSVSAGDALVTPDDLHAGQRWRVTVADAFVKPVPTSGGTYDSTVSTTYIVEVFKGGLYADTPQIMVSTTNGVDLSGPTDVAAASSAVAVGTHGATIQFTGNGLRKGDRYYVPVTGIAAGPMRTLVLGHNLDTDIADDSEVDVLLFIRKPSLEVAKNTGTPPLTNWDTAATELTVHSGIEVFDESWTDSGTPVALPVWSEASKNYGLLYVEYRAWMPTLCNEVGGIDDAANIDQISGPLHPDNPLKWGVFKALENANGETVLYTAVCDPDDTDSWVRVLELLYGRDDVHGLVPLTRNRTVLDLYAAHITAASSAERGLWRRGWFNLAGVPTIPVVSAGSDVPGHLEATTTDGEVCLCVAEDDPLTSGTQYTIIRCTSGNGAFLTNNVRAGDTVRLLYTSDGFGHTSYTELVIDAVQSEDQVRVLTGPEAPITVGARTEIWRNLSLTEEAAEIGRQAGSWGSRRISAVWPDRIETSGTIQEGYFLCASLAGEASGIVPHQGMTQLELTGYTDVSRTTRFNLVQLNAMAAAGVWIVAQDQRTGRVYTRHAVTTGDTNDVNAREEMVVRNVDSISYRFKDTYAPYIGKANVTPPMLQIIRDDTTALKLVLQASSFTPQLGGQLIDLTINSIHQHLTLKDRVVVDVTLVIPYPLNNIEVHLALAI